MATSAGADSPAALRVRELVATATALRTRAGTREAHPLLDEAKALCAGDAVPAPWRVRVTIERGFYENATPGGEVTHARGLIEAALNEAVELEEPLLEALALRELARLRRREDYEGSVRQLERAAKMTSDLAIRGYESPFDLSLPHVAALIHHTLVLAHERKGRWSLAMDAVHRARSIRDLATLPSKWLQFARSHAGLARQRAMFELHESIVEEVEARVPEFGDLALVAATRMRAGMSARLGHYEEAIDLYLEVRAQASSLGTRGNLTNAAALAALHLGDLDRVDTLCDEADTIWAAYGNARVGRLTTLRRRARAAAARGEYRRALELLLSFLNQEPDLLPLRATLSWTLEVLERAAHAGQAPADFAGLVLTSADPPISMQDWGALARLVLHVVGEYPDSDTVPLARRTAARLALRGHIDALVTEAQLEQSYQSCIEQHRLHSAAAMAAVIAQMKDRSGDDQDAFAWAMRAVEDVEAARARIRGEFDRTRVANDQREAFLLAWSLAGRRGDGLAAVRIAEAARGTTLHRLLFHDLPSVVSEVFAVDELTRPATEPEVDDETTVAPVADGNPFPDAMDEERDYPLVSVRRGIAEQLRAISPMLADMAYPERLDPTVLASRFGDHVVIHVDIEGRLVYSAATLDGHCHVGAPAVLSSWAANLLRVLCSGDSRASELARERQGPTFWKLMAEVTTAILPAEVAHRIRHATSAKPLSLAIIPSGALWALPVAALFFDGEPLIARCEITVMPSMHFAVLVDQLRARPATQPRSACGYTHPDLVGGRREMQALRRILDAQLSEITEPSEFLESLRHGLETDVLSVAAHGADGGGGFHQELQLTDEVSIPVGEMLEMHFPAIAVFGACWLGRMSSGHGSDPLGLPVACLVKGATSFIGGLFGIHDVATAVILEATYERLFAGENPAAALREAQLEYYLDGLDGRGDPAPLREWAGLVCIGVPPPHQQPPRLPDDVQRA